MVQKVKRNIDIPITLKEQYPTIASRTLVVKDARKMFTVHVTNVCTVSRGTTPLIRYKMEVKGQLRAPASSPPRKSPRSPLNGRLHSWSLRAARKKHFSPYRTPDRTLPGLVPN